MWASDRLQTLQYEFYGIWNVMYFLYQRFIWKRVSFWNLSDERQSHCRKNYHCVMRHTSLKFLWKFFQISNETVLLSISSGTMFSFLFCYFSALFLFDLSHKMLKLSCANWKKKIATVAHSSIRYCPSNFFYFTHRFCLFSVSVCVCVSLYLVSEKLRAIANWLKNCTFLLQVGVNMQLLSHASPVCSPNSLHIFIATRRVCWKKGAHLAHAIENEKHTTELNRINKCNEIL